VRESELTVGPSRAAHRGRVGRVTQPLTWVQSTPVDQRSQDFQGDLNGGVETGERAAGEILGDYRAGILP
jgi:hypothetical protein